MLHNPYKKNKESEISLASSYNDEGLSIIDKKRQLQNKILQTLHIQGLLIQ